MGSSCARFLAVGICVAASFGCTSLCAQEQREDASIEQLMSMLQTIDPYRPNDSAKGKVKVYGSTSMDAMAHGWIGGFKQFHENVEVIVSAAGSEATFKELVANPSSLGMLSRPVKEEELAELKKKGLKDPAAFVVAREALGVFVNAQNPVQTMTGEQLRTVFTVGTHPGDLKWDVMGLTGAWASKPMNVISRTENSGTQKFLADFVFCFCSLREGVSSHVSNAEVLKEVSQNPYSIAICGLRSIGSSVKSLQLTADNQVVPSDDRAILSGQYPLTRPLTIVIDRGQTSPDAKACQEFVRYALCRAGQTQAVIDGFYPVDLPLLRASMQRLDAKQLR